MFHTEVGLLAGAVALGAGLLLVALGIREYRHGHSHGGNGHGIAAESHATADRRDDSHRERHRRQNEPHDHSRDHNHDHSHDHDHYGAEDGHPHTHGQADRGFRARLGSVLPFVGSEGTLGVVTEATLILEFHGNTSGIDEDVAFAREICTDDDATARAPSYLRRCRQHNACMSKINRRDALRTLGVAATAGVVGLAGCSGGDGDGGDGGDESNGGDGGDGGDGGGSTDGGGALDSLSIGMVTSTSGPFAVFGNAAVTGAELAMEDLESEFDVNIDLSTDDSQLDPGTALDRARAMVTEEQVDFLMGAVSSSVALRLGGWTSKNEVTYFSTGAHSSALTGKSCGKYMFRPSASNSMLAAGIGSDMVEAADEWFLMYSDYTWGQTAVAAVRGILEEQGKTVVGTEAVPFPSDDYAQYVNRAEASGAPAIGVLIAGLDLRKAANQIIASGIQDRTLAMHQLEDFVFWGMGKESASILDIAGQVWGPAADGGDEFKQRVADRGDMDPYVRHLLGYISMDQGVRAAMRAGSTAAPDMRDALEGHQVESPIVDMKGGSEMYWRAGDHQLIQPTYTVTSRPTDEMSDDPYKEWFAVENKFAGDDVARSVDETGCSL
jgi:branched-chain amino acid transport system substrate-binding protein